ncbi:DUF6228 family protein [Streptomyces niveus]|uniref:DUF6228 family protein n=1 Tax=Streptomyces niveus TaxID=193462 RepID=UPI00369FE270
MTSPESVIIRCQDHAAVGVTFRDRFSFDADYRGWDGERSWRTDDADLTVAAVFRSGGYVGLTWTMRPLPEPGWRPASRWPPASASSSAGSGD